ncbi:MAG: sigma-70 family RNA polymerase sigma factor [Pirellulaceae bacterium]|nr:sigma-70 family RNA polymerase sigma factor [Pirellulaceae bacterium]
MNTASTEPELPVDGEFARLMERANRGEVEAQARICEHYEPKVRIIARVMLGPALRSHFDSMDLVQSVHRSLLVGLRDQKFDISTPQKLIALASTIVRRKVARKWRRTRKQQVLTDLDAVGELAQTLSELSSPDANPAQVAEFNDQISALCDQMGEIERRMLALRLDGFTWDEVGAQLGLHPVAARVRWSRLKQRLQDSGIAADWI